MFQTKVAENKENAHFVFNIFSPENRVLYLIMLKKYGSQTGHR
jgi:hypothetical protein